MRVGSGTCGALVTEQLVPAAYSVLGEPQPTLAESACSFSIVTIETNIVEFPPENAHYADLSLNPLSSVLQAPSRPRGHPKSRFEMSA